MPEDGIEFEYWCANELKNQGWDTQVSKASGDQGIDIIAKRDGLSVAVQCKRYNQPIGNKAVQEIFAARQFVRAKHACVIGTGGFTKSAKELAGATEVFLFEAEGGLQNFSERFGFSSIEGNEFKSIGTTNPNDDDEVCIESLRDLLGVEIHFETAEEYLIPQLAKSYLLQVMAMSSDLDTELNNSVIEAISSPRPCTLKLLKPEWKLVLQMFLSSMMSEISSDTKASILGGSGEFSDAVVDAVGTYDECPPAYVALDISQIRDVMLKFSEVLDQIDEPDFDDDDLEVLQFFQEMAEN
jgi:hypothetical protein